MQSKSAALYALLYFIGFGRARKRIKPPSDLEPPEANGRCCRLGRWLSGYVRLLGMVFIAEAFGGWLVSQLADAGGRRLSDWLLGTEQERALRQAATAAIQGTARQLRPAPAAVDDPQGADHLVRVIDQVFQDAPTPMESLAGHATLLLGLKSEVSARLAILGIRTSPIQDSPRQSCLVSPCQWSRRC
jgi:hypothetical protein